MIYFDFEKAFDKVPHAKLFKKLEFVGIDPDIIRWIKNFLHERTYQVRVGHSFSQVYSSPSGVPQGGVLSPLLFLLYTFDLPAHISSEVSCQLYADDVKIYRSVENQNDLASLQTAIDSVCAWAEKNALPLAPRKIKVLCLGSNKFPPPYRIGNLKLQVVSEMRDLGFLVSDKLSFLPHLKTIHSKALARTYSLFKALKTRDVGTLVKAYKTYVRPLVESGTTVFSPSLKKDINLLESVQNNFTRKLVLRCSGIDYRFIPNGEERRKMFELPSLRSRRLRNDLVMAYKILTGKSHLDSAKFFSIYNSTTRGGFIKIRTPRVRTRVRSAFFCHRVIPSISKFITKGWLLLSFRSFKKLVSLSVLAH